MNEFYLESGVAINGNTVEKGGLDSMNRPQVIIRVAKLMLILGVILCLFLGGCAKVVVRVSAIAPSGERNDLTPKCDLHEKSLVVEQFEQITGQWCWAATAQIVMNYHRKSMGLEALGQCQLVSQVLPGQSGESCCPEGENDIAGCHKGWWVEKALEENGYEYSEPKSNPGREELWHKLTSQICADKPVVYESHLQGFGGHSNVIYGYRDDGGVSGRWVEIYDPQTEPWKREVSQVGGAQAEEVPDYQQVNFDEDLVFVSENEDTSLRSGVWYIFDIQP